MKLWKWDNFVVVFSLSCGIIIIVWWCSTGRTAENTRLGVRFKISYKGDTPSNYISVSRGTY